MPAEKIQSPGTPGAPESPHLRISWGIDMGYVQAATLYDAKHGADVIIGIVNEWLKAAGIKEIPGREELDRRITEKADPDSIAAQFGIGFDGFHASIDDRRNLNHLIATARKARDQAFGKDE